MANSKAKFTLPSGFPSVIPTKKITQHAALSFQSRRHHNGNPTDPVIVNGVHQYPLLNGSGLRFSVRTELNGSVDLT